MFLLGNPPDCLRWLICLGSAQLRIQRTLPRDGPAAAVRWTRSAC